MQNGMVGIVFFFPYEHLLRCHVYLTWPLLFLVLICADQGLHEQYNIVFFLCQTKNKWSDLCMLTGSGPARIRRGCVIRTIVAQDAVLASKY